MVHARLINKFNNNALKLIQDWNNGFYNVNGFDKCIEDLKNLYYIKFFSDYYEECNTHHKKIHELLGTDNNQISLSFRNFKLMTEQVKSYNKTLNIISKKLSINVFDFFTECNKYRFTSKEVSYTDEFFTYDLVTSPSHIDSILSFDDFINKQSDTDKTFSEVEEQLKEIEELVNNKFGETSFNKKDIVEIYPNGFLSKDINNLINKLNYR